MYKETFKTTKFIDFKIQKYSLSMTIQYHSDNLILFLSHGKYKCVLSHPMGFPWGWHSYGQACCYRSKPWASAEIFPGDGAKSEFCYHFQVADDKCKRTFTKRFTLFLYHKDNAPCYGNNHKKCVSLAAIARYITIIYTVGNLQIFNAGQGRI